MHPLLTVEELRDTRDDVVLCDIRWALPDPGKGRETYLKGHIPGALYVDLDRDLAGPPNAGRHPLPTAEAFAGTLGRLGISTDSRVVAYDDMGNTVAARMWWMLRSIGHERVQVLDGGYQAWAGFGLPVETGEEFGDPTVYPASEFTGHVTHEELCGRVIIDVRSGPRYRGEHEPIDAKPGHIPGAVNLATTDLLGDTGAFLAGPDLERAFLPYAGATPVVSCGSGVNACHTALAMTVAGHDMPDIYVGSYSEWSALGKKVHTGDQP